MRHLKRTAKLGRQFEHRNAMLANLVGSLIKHGRVTTTLAKAKAARSVAEKMVTLGKTNTLHARRLAAARLRQQPRSHFKGTPTKKGAVVRSTVHQGRCHTFQQSSRNAVRATRIEDASNATHTGRLSVAP